MRKLGIADRVPATLGELKEFRAELEKFVDNINEQAEKISAQCKNINRQSEELSSIIQHNTDNDQNIKTQFSVINGKINILEAQMNRVQGDIRLLMNEIERSRYYRDQYQYESNRYNTTNTNFDIPPSAVSRCNPEFYGVTTQTSATKH